MNPKRIKWISVSLAILVIIFVGGSWIKHGMRTENNPSPEVMILKNSDISTTTKLSSTTKSSSTQDSSVQKTPVFYYIEIINGCGPYYNDTPCVNMRSGPGLNFPVVDRLRTGIVLKVEKMIAAEGQAWYKIIFDESIRYSERVAGDWYVAVDSQSVQPLENIGDEILTSNTATTTKNITVDLTNEMLYAYDGTTLFMQEPISTGLELTPTLIGTFKVFRKTPSRYMQGPIPGVSDQVYDLPGVPWNLYFNYDGSVIHGAYWHDHFGQPWSHGCVNLSPENAKKLYLWADVLSQ
jgi:hypothetical protein